LEKLSFEASLEKLSFEASLEKLSFEASNSASSGLTGKVEQAHVVPHEKLHIFGLSMCLAFE
jgi:hypothetical protein